jgi:hypothetical protein
VVVAAALLAAGPALAHVPDDDAGILDQAPASPAASSQGDRSFSALFVLLGGAVLFLAVQSRLDRRGPKLAPGSRDTGGRSRRFR